MKGMGCITFTFEIELFSFSFKNSKKICALFTYSFFAIPTIDLPPTSRI
jgi:hypothetical protein